MANASSLNTLYSLINGPNADRIGGFIANAQVDDAARLREATRLADANLALGNKQTEYSLAAALSRSPETAAMFQPGREVLAPDAADMAYSLMDNVPKMQNAEIAGKQAAATYQLAAAKNMERLAAGGGSGSGSSTKAPVDTTTKDQGRIVSQYNTAMNNISGQETRILQALSDGIGKVNGNAMLSPTAKQKAIADLQGNTSKEVARLRDERERIKQTFAPLITKGMSTLDGSSAPTGEGLVQPAAAPQAKAPAAPSNDERAIRVQQAKQHYARLANDPQGRAELLKRAASMGITEKDLQ